MIILCRQAALLRIINSFSFTFNLYLLRYESINNIDPLNPSTLVSIFAHIGTKGKKSVDTLSDPRIDATDYKVSEPTFDMSVPRPILTY